MGYIQKQNSFAHGEECYLPTIIVIVTLLEDAIFSSSPLWQSISMKLLYDEYLRVGSFGMGSGMPPLSNQSTTCDIIGLQTAESCTHNNPICTNLDTSLLVDEPAIEESRSSIALPSLQSFQDCIAC